MWKNEAMSAVVFPSAETLPTLRQLDEENQKLLLILNPQWQTAGQLVSDFGCAVAQQCNMTDGDLACLHCCVTKWPAIQLPVHINACLTEHQHPLTITNDFDLGVVDRMF